MNPRRAPKRIFLAHTAHEISGFLINSGPAAWIVRFPAPPGAKTHPVPANDCLRTHDRRGVADIGETPIQPDEQRPITAGKPQPFGAFRWAREAWALAAYGRVAERYEQLRREYAQAVIQATANQPSETVSLPEGSRLKLQQIVRAEIQRAAIDNMRNSPVDYNLIEDYPYTNADGTLGVQPTTDRNALLAAEPEVQFLQQAFEWEHLAWIVYPLCIPKT
jgi:hypothetical protein